MESADRRWVESMAAAYERDLVPTVFRPFARDLADRAARHGARTILELAAGTGVLTAELLVRLPAAEVVATDLNDAMVALGAPRAAGAVWRTADATDLPFEDSSFDLVLCQFGAMFFPNKVAAFSEVQRVLIDGGRCLVSAWGPLDAHDLQAAVVAACDRLFPHDPPKFMRSVPHFYADVDTLVVDVGAGGLRVLDVEELELESPPAPAKTVATGYCYGTPLRAEIEARGGSFETVVEAIAAEIETSLGPDAPGRMRAHIVTATR